MKNTTKSWVMLRRKGEFEGTVMQQVRQKLANCQTELSTWSAKKFGDLAKRLKKKMKDLEVLQREEGSENWEQIKELQTDIDFILEKDDFKWK